ncbi:serine hydrolase domain-containing protein [Amorphoplanes digitatis]|uniref:D-alanyl-D-alanine carboxypeptidase n=1 Tax=Actinoplanes digitatis TaxID=1868 RepID=A0A7W7I0V8_9ACTN|nr:serine hydrolase domain-containing protein [Actinoplanes digitatis]MBB4764295.1 D-alanyl-D-alanine carboxypeptidase [Actinoplanes digitatis]GID96312.1 serine hydrolase [Actinoplanes digitatis]
MRKHLGRLGLAAALTAALVAGTTVPATAATAHDGRRLQAALDDLHDLGITGVQGLTRVDGDTVRARAGVGDQERGSPVPLDGHFRMGSNTKTFVSVVVLQLVGEGRLSLDDTVERWLPGLVTGNGNDGRRITVRNLLQHTSGLYNYTGDITALGSQEDYLAHRYDHYEAEDLVALATKHEPGFAPGTSWDYSNTNYILAGMIIERATGRAWATEVRARILRPLGLSHTSEPGDRPYLPAPHAKGYQQWAPGGALHDTTRFNPTVADAAGSLITTPTDLARFWQALQRGRLLKPRQMAQLHQTVLAETFQDYIPGARYGLGIMFIPNRCGGYWSHGGDVPGMSTANAVDADGDRVAVLSLSTQLADEEPAAAVSRRTFRLMDDVICGPA